MLEMRRENARLDAILEILDLLLNLVEVLLLLCKGFTGTRDPVRSSVLRCVRGYVLLAQDVVLAAAT